MIPDYNHTTSSFFTPCHDQTPAKDKQGKGKDLQMVMQNLALLTPLGLPESVSRRGHDLCQQDLHHQSLPCKMRERK